MADIVLQLVRDALVASEVADLRVQRMRMSVALEQVDDDDDSLLAQSGREAYQELLAQEAAAKARLRSSTAILDELLADVSS